MSHVNNLNGFSDDSFAMQTHANNLNGFSDDSSEMLTLDDLLIILPKNGSSTGDEADFQPNTFSSTQNQEFSLFLEPSAQTTSTTWNGENVQPEIAATWRPPNVPATAFMTSQPTDMQPTTVASQQPLAAQPLAAQPLATQPLATQPLATQPLAAQQPLAEQPPQVQAAQLIYSTEEFPSGIPPPVIAVELNVKNPSPSNFDSYICGICGDRATGKHYGAISCDGCKGFFRRSVRKNQEYACRFQRSCVVTREKRNQCRFCRLRKCFVAGMKKEAVQNERDKISYRRSSQKPNQGAGKKSTISNLLRAEDQHQTLEASITVEQVASIPDICSSMREELFHLVDWAKRIPEFVNLSLQDQLTLLKTGGAEHLVLGVAKRSMRRHDSLLLGNKRVILKDLSNMDSVDDVGAVVRNKIAMINHRIFKELIQPWRNVNMDDVEYTCLKTIVFFNPNAKGLVDGQKVETFRNEVQMNFENYVSDRQYEGAGRLGKLLLTLPSLQSITKEMTDDVIYAEIFYGLQMDDKLREIF